MTEALKSQGFKDIKTVSSIHSGNMTTEKFCRMMQSNPGFGLLKQKLGEEGWNRYKEEIDRLFKEKYPDYSLSCEALLAVATK